MSQPKPKPKSSSSGVRPYYVFTAAVLGIGAVLAVVKGSWISFFVFSVLCAMAVWVAARYGPAPEPGSEKPSRQRPSERRRQRRAQRGN